MGLLWNLLLFQEMENKSRLLHSSDVIELYFKTIEKIDEAKGKVFNIGGGVENSLSILELFTLLNKFLDIKMNYIELPFRTSDQLIFIANYEKAKSIIGWYPRKTYENGIINTIKGILEK